MSNDAARSGTALEIWLRFGGIQKLIDRPLQAGGFIACRLKATESQPHLDYGQHHYKINRHLLMDIRPYRLILSRPKARGFHHPQRGTLITNWLGMTLFSQLANIVVLAAVVLLYGCKSSPVDWEAFARRSYVDVDRAQDGRDEFGWFIKGQRAPQSIVSSTEGSLSQRERQVVLDTLAPRVVSSALMDAVVPDSVRVWATHLGGRAISLNVLIPSAGASMVDIVDQFDRVVSVPNINDRLEAVLWVESGQVTIVRLVEAVREDYEKQVGSSWSLQDVIDLDRDEAPDLVLGCSVYERSSLAIVSVVKNQVIERWKGLHRGM